MSEIKNIEIEGGLKLSGLDRVNVLLGKNGSGKSRALRLIDQHHSSINTGSVRYIAPERAGALEAAPGHEGDLSRMGEAWMAEVGRVNQYPLFKQQSVILLKRLELATLRDMERRTRETKTIQAGFEEEFELINTLLERVRLERRDVNGRPFAVVDRASDSEEEAAALSSGEAELISLAIEVLHFRSVCGDKPGLMLIDEPDVHLHPDLQDRLAGFIIEVFKNTKISILLSTHSTALVAGLSERASVKICFMKKGETNLIFRSVTEIDRAILPIFGAHPLSALFTKAPLLLVEGTDEERIWTQTVRSSHGKIHFQVCEVGGKGNFPEYEREVNDLLGAVYDDATAYSLRDRDDHPEDLPDNEHIIRCRLSCRASENLVLTDESLAQAGLNWESLIDAMETWLLGNKNHQFHSSMVAFRDTGYDRKGFDLKNLRNIIAGLISTKPWEVLVGQSIAKWHSHNEENRNTALGSMHDFLGSKVRSQLLKTV